MALNHSPQVVTNGLVFYYDMANTHKSWRGAPTTNIYPIDNYISWPTETYHFWNGNSWLVDSTYTDPGAPGPQGVYLGKVRKYTSGAMSSTWDGHSFSYVLKSAVMTQGQSYAMTGYAYISKDCDITAITSSIEGTSPSSMSGFRTDYDMAKKGSWQRFGLTASAPSTSINFIPFYARKLNVTNGTFKGFYLVGGAMVETGNYPTRYTDGVRSSAQSVLDLTGLNTITANSLTYPNDGNFSFNGSTNFITVPSPTMPTDFFTIEMIINPTSLAVAPVVICPQNAGIDQFIRINTNGTIIFNFASAGDTGERAYISTATCQLNQHSHIVCVKNGVNVAIYKDGVLTASSTADTLATAGWGSTTWSIGQRGNSTFYFSGTIPLVKAYNRGLSALEVSQNFNAIRGRYGI